MYNRLCFSFGSECAFIQQKLCTRIDTENHVFIHNEPSLVHLDNVKPLVHRLVVSRVMFCKGLSFKCVVVELVFMPMRIAAVSDAETDRYERILKCFSSNLNDVCDYAEMNTDWLQGIQHLMYTI